MTEHGVGEHGHAPGLFPVPGDGVLARRGDLILLCTLEDSQTADDLLDLLEQVAESGGDGRQFTDAIADALESGDRLQSVLAFGPSDSGLAVTVSGGAWADVITDHATVRVEAGHPDMLLRCALRSPVSEVRGGLGPDDVGAASTDRFSRLDAGTVRAGGLSFYQAGLAEAAAGGRVESRGPVSGRRVRLGKSSRIGSAPAQTPAAQARLAGVPVAELPESEGAAGGSPGTQAEPELGSATPVSEPAEAAAAGAAAAEEPPGFAPTAAWVSPEQPDAGQDHEQRQPTELWSAPPGEPDSGPAGLPPGGGVDAGDLQREVTAPPEPYEPSGQPYAPAEPGQPFEAVVLLDGGRSSGIEQQARPPLPKVRDLPPGTSSYVSAGPIIQGVYCKNGHFDDPDALFCAICGISMNQQTLVPRPGERPPLGVLLLDDGSVFQLDTDYVIGREPSLDSSVASGKARPLRVADDSGIVSRVHAKVDLEGWRVLVTDLGSANGTRVLLPGQPADQQLVPQVPIVLAAGSQVDLGGRAFRYESHRGR